MPEASAPRQGSLRRNAAASVGGRGASALIWVLVTPFALSRLGTERFAVWSLFFVVGGYMSTLDLGTSNSVTRFVAMAAARGDRKNLLDVLRRSLMLSTVIGLVWGGACLLGRFAMMDAFHVPAALRPEVATALLVFAASLFAAAWSQVLQGALVGLQRLDLSNLSFLTGLLVHGVALVVGLAMGGGLIAAAVAATCGQVLSGLMAYVLMRRRLHDVPDAPTSTRVTWRELIHFSGAVQVTSVSHMAHVQTGKVMLGVLGQLMWVTQFELGFRVANAVWSLPSLVHPAVIAASAHASAHADRARIREVYDWACRWIFALSGLVLGGLWLVAPPLLTLWVGPGHDASVGATRGLCIAFAFATLSGPATAVARGGGWAALEAIHFVAALALNVAISLWAVPRFQVPGACAAMAIAYALPGAWLVGMIHRALGVPNAAWVTRIAAPRYLAPAAIAAALALAWPGHAPVDRSGALIRLLLQGGAFVALLALITWPTGDARAVWSRIASLRGRRGAPASPGMSVT